MYIKTGRKNEYISDYFDRLAGNVPVLLGSCPWGEVAERKTWSVRRRMSCSSKPLYLTVIRFPVFYLSYLYIMVEYRYQVAGIKIPVRGKSGENPARTGHCIRLAAYIMPLRSA